MSRSPRCSVGGRATIRMSLCWVVRYVGGEEGVELEADERHGELIKTDMGIEPGSKGVVSPVLREEAGEGISRLRRLDIMRPRQERTF